MSTMNIGYLVPEWPSQTHAFFWRELTALRDSGARVRVYSTRRPDSRACRHQFAESARSETHYVFPPSWVAVASQGVTGIGAVVRMLRYVIGLKETGIRARLKLIALVPSALDLAADALRNGIHHVHCHSCADAAHLLAMASMVNGLTYSLVLHGDLPVYGVDHAAKMGRAAFVVAVTRPLQRQVCDHMGWDESRVLLCWMGVNTDIFTPSAAAENEADPLRVVTVARLNATKGHLFALEAIRNLKLLGVRCRYKIVGDGPHGNALVRNVAELGLESDVEFTGSLSEPEVRDALLGSQVFVLPSFGLGEAAPVSVMEAMACGLPVICSRIGGTADMITTGVDGFLVGQRDTGEIEAAIRLLASDSATRRRISLAARQRAIEQFDYRICAQRLLDHLRTVLATRASGSPGTARKSA
jgi:glycosyltransferase involved in cell wall biosynthesis